MFLGAVSAQAVCLVIGGVNAPGIGLNAALHTILELKLDHTAQAHSLLPAARQLLALYFSPQSARMQHHNQHAMRAELFEGAYAREPDSTADEQHVPVQALVEQALGKHAATTEALQRSAKVVNTNCERSCMSCGGNLDCKQVWVSPPPCRLWRRPSKWLLPQLLRLMHRARGLRSWTLNCTWSVQKQLLLTNLHLQGLYSLCAAWNHKQDSFTVINSYTNEMLCGCCRSIVR